jgi:hypothetical protein
MNELESAIVATLQADAQEAAMSTNTPEQQEILDSRLDTLDRRTHSRRLVWGSVAAAAAVVLVVAGVRAVGGPGSGEGTVVSPVRPLFSSTSFGVPFTVQTLPSWLTTQTLSPTAEALEWVTWNRCPQDVQNECIGLSFNRYGSVQLPTSRKAVTFTSYLAYLDQLGSSGKVEISSRTETRVDGRRAVVYDITATLDILDGVGCHALGQEKCDDFYADVPGRYAVIDTDGLDPTGAVLNVWTRAGGVGPAEVGWKEQFDQMLTTLRFTK